MKQFQKNVLRLAVKNRGSLLGAVLIIALGIFVMVAMEDTLLNLKNQISAYYAAQQLSDLFAEVSGISEAELQRLLEIPGISAASGRMSAELRIIEGEAPASETLNDIVTVHLLSSEEGATLNRPRLSAPMQSSDDIFLGPRMSAVYRFPIGTELRLLCGGESFRFRYAGTVSQPDYIYSVPPGGSMIPDGSIYDIAMISPEKMSAMLHSSARTELAFSLAPGVRFEDIRHELQEHLTPYGLKSLCDRPKQTSYAMVDDEFHELRATGTMLPMLFLSVSVFMLYIVLKKMIDQERVLIGTMKAFGLSSHELISGYLMLGLLIGACGALLGGLLAGFFGRFMFRLYCDYFNLPDPRYHDYLTPRLYGLLLAAFSSTAAVLSGTHEILSIAPAAAMRQQSPAKAVNALLPPHLFRRLPLLSRIALRSLQRNPLRSFLIVLAVAFPFSMASVLFSYPAVVDHMLREQFQHIECYDLQLHLDSPVSPERAADAALTLKDCAEAETVLQLPAAFQRDALTEYALLTALPEKSHLWHIIDAEGKEHAPPRCGIILNQRTADKLKLSAGDRVRILIPGLLPEARELPVLRVIQETFGSGAYLALDSLPDQLGTDRLCNKLILRAKPGAFASLKSDIRSAGRISWIVDMPKSVKTYQDMMGSMFIMVNSFAVMSLIAGGILIYNISLITLRERISELTTLRVLGCSEMELGQMLLIEQGVLLFLGILLGMPGNYLVRGLLERFMTSDNYHIQLNLHPASCVLAFFCCIFIVLFSLHREISVISAARLTDALKERE